MTDKRLLLLPWHPHTKGSTRALGGLGQNACASEISGSLPEAGFMVRIEWRKSHAERDIWPTLARELDAAPPEYAVYFQRLYHQDVQLRRVLERHKVKQVCLDLAPIPFRHYEAAIFDNEGENAASGIVGKLDYWLEHPVQRAAIEKRLKDVYITGKGIEVFSRIYESTDGFEPSVKDLDLPDDFIFVALQMPHDQVVLHDSPYRGEDCMKILAKELIAEAERRGCFVVIKPHPMDVKWEKDGMRRGKHHLILPKYFLKDGEVKPMRAPPKDNINDKLCSYLWRHCAKCVVVNSTMLFGALFAGRPVAMLGRGWATGNGVVQECQSVAEVFEDFEPDAERVQQFLALILSRCRTHGELRNPIKVRQLFNFLDALRGDYQYVAPKAPTIIKSVYIPNKEKLRLVKYCLQWTVKKNPDSRIILAIDYAPVEFDQWAQELSPMVEVVRLKDGKPPRMNLHIAEALKHIPKQDEWIITAEQDTIFHNTIIETMKDLIKIGGPKAAAMQAESCLFKSQRCYPSTYMYGKHRIQDGVELDDVTFETTHATFSTTLWRAAALRAVDWNKTRPWMGADMDACNQLKKDGYKFYHTSRAKAIHQSHTKVRDGFSRMNGLHNKHKDKAAYIIGKGPGLDSVTAETFEAGCPIICINESIHIIEALGTDNPLYVIQQDKSLKESCKPERGLLLLAGLCKAYYKDFKRKVIHTPADLGVKRKDYWPHSSLVAVKYARMFACNELRMVGFDQIVNGATAYADCIKGESLIPISARLQLNNHLLLDEIGDFPATWLNAKVGAAQVAWLKNVGDGSGIKIKAGDVSAVSDVRFLQDAKIFAYHLGRRNFRILTKASGGVFVKLPEEEKQEGGPFADLINDGAWKGKRCFIVGGGPSLEGFDWSLLNGELVIAVNRSFENCNPQIITSCDADFIRWIEGKRDDGSGLCPPETMQLFWSLKCLRAIVNVPKQKYNYPPGLNMLRCAGNDGLSNTLREGIVCGRNSGFAGMSLAMLLEADPIYLLGFDMQHRPGDNKAHYYDKGKPRRPEDSYHKHYRHYFDKVAPEIKARGHRIINLSKNSALKCFEKGEFPEPSTRPVYVSYYTVGSAYEKEVDNLVLSLIQHGLPYEIWPMKSLGSWAANCRLCPTVCREAMEKYPNRPVVYLDADSIVRQPPELLESMPGDIDLAVSYIKFHPRQPKKLGAGCVYFAPTAKAMELVKEWERRCRLEQSRGDSEILQEIIDEGAWDGKRLNLPGEYCKVFDNHTQEGAGEPPVIEALQASRRFKADINKAEASEKAKYEKLWRSGKYLPSKTQGKITGALLDEKLASGEVLDIGCGNGAAVEELIKAGVNAQGVDITLAGLPRKRKARYTEAPLWCLPFGNGQFDTTYSSDVLEHLPPDKVEAAIGEILRITKGVTVHVIATFSCTSYGQELHLTRQPIEWWQEQFSKATDANLYRGKCLVADRKDFMEKGLI